MLEGIWEIFGNSTQIDWLTEVLSAGLFVFACYLFLQIKTIYYRSVGIQGFFWILAVGIATCGSLLVHFLSGAGPGTEVLYFWIFACLLAALFSPALAIAVNLGLLLIRPWELRAGWANLLILPRFMLLMLLLSVAMQWLINRGYRPGWKREIWIMLAFCGWMFLSTFAGGSFVENQEVFFDGFFKSVTVGVLILILIRDRTEYETLVSSLVIAGLLTMVFALVNTQLTQSVRLESQGAVQNSNDLAAIAILLLPFLIRRFLRGTWNVFDLALAALDVPLLIWCLKMAQSRAAFLALGAMLFGGVLFFRRKARGAIIAGLVGASAVVLAGSLFITRGADDMESSSTNRFGYWKAAVAMAIRHPLFGVGYKQFPENFAQYGADEITEPGKRTTHSTWMLVFAEAGVPGLALLILLYAIAVKRAWRCEDAPELFLALAGYGVEMTFLSHSDVLYPYVLIALALAYPIQRSVPIEVSV